MTKIIATASISLDGKIALPDDDPGPIFDWYESGDVGIAPGDPEREFHLSRASADYVAGWWSTVGVEVIGRRLFDITNGWEGRPPAGSAGVVVVTHTPPTSWAHFGSAPFTFVDGLDLAITVAREQAGDKDVTITGGELTGQALTLGLIDELRLELAPVILGAGIDFFGAYSGGPILLEDPEIVPGERVTHLHYRVRRQPAGSH